MKTPRHLQKKITGKDTSKKQEPCCSMNGLWPCSCCATTKAFALRILHLIWTVLNCTRRASHSVNELETFDRVLQKHWIFPCMQNKKKSVENWILKRTRSKNFGVLYKKKSILSFPPFDARKRTQAMLVNGKKKAGFVVPPVIWCSRQERKVEKTLAETYASSPNVGFQHCLVFTKY